MSKTENKIKYEDVKDNFISYSYEEHPVKMDDVILVDRNAYIKDMTKEFIEELKYRQELLDYNIPQTRTLLFTGAPGLGKSLSLDSKILTPTGWKLMRNIKIGDVIFDGNGNKTKVLGVYPQGERQTYKIYFNDGTYIIVDEEHLNPFYQWKRIKSSTQYINNKKKKVYNWGKKEQVLKTKDLIKYFNKCKKRHDKPLRIETPIIHFEEQKLNLDPYILGILLGDGCITGNSNLSFANLDIDIIYSLDSYCKLNGDTLKISLDKRQAKNKQCNYIIYGDNIKSKLKNYNLIGTYSNTKFIPKEFLFNSIENRIALLQGLMDTDGCCWNQKRIKKSGTYYGGYFEYLTVSKQLSDNFAFLVRSLGGVDKITIKKCHYYNKDGNKKICKNGYRHYIRFPKNIIPFRCERKKSNMTVKEFIPLRKIVNIKKYKKVKCQCIYVDSPKHTYIANDFIPTHNTYLAKAISTELKLPLYIVDVAETLGKNNGLEQMKKILQFCRDPDNQPCILFMDECDGLAASREDKSKSSSDKTGDNRITNYIMQCLQEENDSKTSRLIVIAATNFPEGLDVAFVNRFQLQFTYYLPDHYVPFIEMEMKKNKMFTLVKDVNDNEIEIIDINANKAGFSIRQLNAKILWAYKRAVIEKCKEGTLDGEPIPIKLSTILQQIAIEIQFGIDLNEIKNYEKQQEQDDFDKYVVNNKENN